MSETKPAIFSAQIVDNGRITIPEHMRRIWKLKKGDVIELQILRTGK